MSSRLRPGRRRRSDARSTNNNQPHSESNEAGHQEFIQWERLKKMQSEKLTTADDVFVADIIKVYGILQVLPRSFLIL